MPENSAHAPGHVASILRAPETAIAVHASATSRPLEVLRSANRGAPRVRLIHSAPEAAARSNHALMRGVLLNRCTRVDPCLPVPTRATVPTESGAQILFRAPETAPES